jgi:hypothetical protein
MATWQVINNKLTHDDLPEPLTGNYIQPPYPPFWWYANDVRLTHGGLPEPISAIMSEPYPPFWWYVENGRLKTPALPAPAHTGAFYGCSQLATAHIPKSVKRIGEYAFADTALTKVKIASDCTYYPTSFPDGCEIEFYPDDNESVGDNDG